MAQKIHFQKSFHWTKGGCVQMFAIDTCRQFGENSSRIKFERERNHDKNIYHTADAIWKIQFEVENF